MTRVHVIGSLNVDRPWSVGRHPAVGETVLGERGRPIPGGKGLNQAVAARRLGASVVLVGRVGDDDDGRWLRGIAEAEGIDVRGVGTDPSRPTGSALIVVDDHGDNTIVVSPGANRGLVADISADAARFHVGDHVVAQLEVPAGTVVELFERARRAGAITVLNPSPVPEDPAVLDCADIVVVNEHEAARLTREAVAGDPDAALEQARRLVVGRRAAVVTLGPMGVVAAGVDGIHRVDGISVEAVDSTGAGDCFLGALTARLAVGSVGSTR